MKKLILLALISCSFILSHAQESNKHLNLNKKQIAVDGYDLISYIKDNKATTGNIKYKCTYKQAHYFFSNEKHQNIFKKSPEKYLPTYGGWCAYAMGEKGEKVSVDPKSFLVIDNKLYLFYDSFFNDTKEKWNKDPINLKNNADINWKKLN
jgi:YHS domain-containing protein